MRVVFLENVPRVANVGEIKAVSNGYGRNYLIPRKLAIIATPAALKQLERQQQLEAQRATLLEAKADELAQQLNDVTITIMPKVGAQGRLYGSVTNTHIAKELETLTGHPFDHRRVLLENPIRRLGSYPVEVRLTNELSVAITVQVGEPAQRVEQPSQATDAPSAAADEAVDAPDAVAEEAADAPGAVADEAADAPDAVAEEAVDAPGAVAEEETDEQTRS